MEKDGDTDTKTKDRILWAHTESWPREIEPKQPKDKLTRNIDNVWNELLNIQSSSCRRPGPSEMLQEHAKTFTVNFVAGTVKDDMKL